MNAIIFTGNTVLWYWKSIFYKHFFQIVRINCILKKEAQTISKRNSEQKSLTPQVAHHLWMWDQFLIGFRLCCMLFRCRSERKRKDTKNTTYQHHGALFDAVHLSLWIPDTYFFFIQPKNISFYWSETFYSVQLQSMFIEHLQTHSNVKLNFCIAFYGQTSIHRNGVQTSKIVSISPIQIT